jgi:hypothetical protein
LAVPQDELNQGSLNMSIPITVGLLAYRAASIVSAVSIASMGRGALSPTSDWSLKKLHMAEASWLPLVGDVMLG